MRKITIGIMLLCWSMFALAQNNDKMGSKPKMSTPEVSITKQSVKIGGQTMELTVKAGTMELRDNQNEAIALFGFTSYTKKNASSTRPIIFAFNGGPGSSSFWLHMGVLGPKRIVVKDPEFTPGAPYTLENNEYSILDKADLVMIDPVGTGLSVPVGKAKFEDFWGVDQDISSISNFIRQYLIENGRLNSPKYLLGESYGTFRNAGIMAYLQDEGIAMNGVIMVSAVFDLFSLFFAPGNDMPYIVHFPTYAATAWYHNKVVDKGESLEAFLEEVRTFTEDEYAPALFKGDKLTKTEKAAIAKKLADYSGLSADYWIKADLRVKNGEYFAELLRDEGELVGRLDSRFRGTTLDGIAQNGMYDPQSKAISPAYITGFLDYFYNELKVNRKLHYQTSASGRKGFKWDWKHKGNMRWGTQAAVNTSDDMARTMIQNPNVKVLILNGYYDIATVFYGVEYTIDHLGLPPEIKENIIMKYYEAGHMMYTHQPSLEKFKKDVSEFIDMTSNN